MKSEQRSYRIDYHDVKRQTAEGFSLADLRSDEALKFS
jgi:hypothetical protein